MLKTACFQQLSEGILHIPGRRTVETDEHRCRGVEFASLQRGVPLPDLMKPVHDLIIQKCDVTLTGLAFSDVQEAVFHVHVGPGETVGFMGTQAREPHDDEEIQQHRALMPLPCVSNRRSEEHTSELQSLMRISYAVFCLKKKKQNT